MLGNQRMWLETFQEYLDLDHEAVVTNPSYSRLKMKIYQREGIDYIFPEVDFQSIDQIYDAAYKIKLFVADRQYLEVKMLFFLNYMSPKYYQVLRYLAVANIDIGLVSLVPGEWTRDRYVEACSYLNIKHTSFADRTIDLNDAEKLIHRCIEDMFSAELSALAINSRLSL